MLALFSGRAPDGTKIVARRQEGGLMVTELYNYVDENAFDVDLGSKVDQRLHQGRITHTARWATRSAFGRMGPFNLRKKVTTTSRLPCLEQCKQPAQITLELYSIEVMSP